MTLQEENKWRALYRRAMCERGVSEILGSALDRAIQREEPCEAPGERTLIGLGRSYRDKSRAMSLRQNIMMSTRNKH